VESWLRGPLRDRLGAALGPGELACSGLIDMRRLRTLAAEHATGRANHGRTLWAALMFDAFLRNARTHSSPRPRERERTIALAM
jgi:asparagine synthase (glutamine-hydrolysing)